jgi:hypothetical protein
VPLPSNSPRTDPKENASSYLDAVAKQQPQNGPQRKRPRCIATAHRRLATCTQLRKQTNPVRLAFIYIDRFAQMEYIAAHLIYVCLSALSVKLHDGFHETGILRPS